MAGLARLSLTSDEVNQFAEEASRILDAARDVASAEVAGVEPTLRVGGVDKALRLRPDVVREGLSRDLALSAVWRAVDGLVRAGGVGVEKMASGEFHDA